MTGGAAVGFATEFIGMANNQVKDGNTRSTRKST